MSETLLLLPPAENSVSLANKASFFCVYSP